MNRELKQKWIAALRSGEYKQGKGTLYRATDDSYCCLGVLCVVAGLAKELVAERGTLYAVSKEHLLFTGQTEHGAPHVPGWAFEKMNDKDDFTFEEIAAYIEQNVPDDPDTVAQPVEPVQT